MFKKLIITGIMLGAAVCAGLATEVTDLRCEYLINPLGIDVVKPRLSWIIKSDQRGEKQTAYQVLVASSEELLKKNQGDLWDSGKVKLDQSIHVEYAGKNLESRMRCFWKVRTWTTGGRAWSKTSTWEMGLLKPDDWKAQWITASKWFVPPSLRPLGLIVSAGGWADVDLGTSLPIDSIRLYFAATNTAPKRFKIEGADEMQFSKPQILVDQTAADYQMSAPGWQEFRVAGIKVRHIRLAITGPSADGNVVVRQMQVISGGKNVAMMRPTREFRTEWNHGHAPFLVDGMPSEGEGLNAPQDACPLQTAPLLRKVFTIQRPVKQARLYVAALGMADVTINGKPVTDTVLGPPFTDYTKRVVYLTHDVTALMTHGDNVIGATLGNGFFSTPSREYGECAGGYGPPRVLIQTEIEYADGTRQTISSDETWKWARSEILHNDTYVQYTEDRRLAKPGWDRSGYDDAGWFAAAIAHSLGGKLVAPMGPPIRVTGELKPERVDGSHAYFKTVSLGWPQVKVNGKAGQQITLRGSGPILSFVLATDGPAVLQPRFMYLSGPVDLEVDGLLEPLAMDAVTIQLARADLKMASSFESSNPFLNTLHDALLCTHLNYNGDEPMDPMREKQGWTQDAQNMFETAAYLTDVASLYRKWWRDFADNQDESGYLGTVMPRVGRQTYDWNSPWWSGVVVLLPWQHYQFYGDRRILAEGYETMRCYVDFLGKLTASGSSRGWDDYPYLNGGDTNSPEAKEGILCWQGAGDWIGSAGVTVPAPLLDMPAWYHYATIVSQTATLLGKTEDAVKYAAMAEGVKNRFNAKYLNKNTGLYGSDPASQTAQALPLALNVVPEEQRERTYQRLLDAIHAHNNHVGTGFVGLPFLLHALIDARETALGSKIVNQQDFPGWKTLMHEGVFFEGWNGGNAMMPSCGGSVGLWLYQSVLGIRSDPAGPGFKNFIIAPQPDSATSLTWARGYYDSVHGRIRSDWKRAGNKLTMDITIPVNTTATVYVPSKAAASITESGKPAAKAKGVKFLRLENGATVYEVVSGKYSFTVTN